MLVIGKVGEAEMVACFLQGELTSERFGSALRQALLSAGWSEDLLTEPDLADDAANAARSDLLGVTRGYRQRRDVFDESYPDSVEWMRAELSPDELAEPRYIEYSYWTELSGGSRLPRDAATRIRGGVRAFEVSNDRFLAAADAVARGVSFPPLILVGTRPDDLVCLEGNLRLTAYALADFPRPTECLIGIAPTMDRWAR